MKTRATSFLLATLAVVSLVLPALAAEPEETLPEYPEYPVESAEIEEVQSAIRLDGENVPNVEYEIRSGVCYVTVSSFVSLLDPEAMVEEENGVVTVSASTVTGIIPMDPEPEAFENAEGPEEEELPEGDIPEVFTEADAAGEAPAVEDGSEEASDPENDAEDAGAEQFEEDSGVVDTANVVTSDLNLTAAAGACYFVANGRYLYAGDGLIQLNGRVAAPVRQLARVFNLAVGYDAENDQVLLDHQEGAEPYLASAAYNGDTLYWLSRIINAESGNQPMEGKIAVGNVVMNRVNDPRFPDSLYDVLFQKNQFGPASSGSIYRDPNWESTVAAMLVMDGAQVTDALFFNGVRARAPRGRVFVATIGDHAFYK